MPAEVTVALGDEIGCVVLLLIGIAEPIALPPVAHPSAELSGPHSENCRLPAQVVVPETFTVAWSVASTDPVPIESPPSGMALPSLSLGVVVTLEPQLPKPPRTKSFSTAVVDVDDRVSDATDAKHRLPRPSA